MVSNPHVQQELFCLHGSPRKDQLNSPANGVFILTATIKQLFSPKMLKYKVFKATKLSMYGSLFKSLTQSYFPTKTQMILLCDNSMQGTGTVRILQPFDVFCQSSLDVTKATTLT